MRELVLTILILTGLLALIATWVVRERAQSRRVQCEARLVELARGVAHYNQAKTAFMGYRNVQAVAPQDVPVITGWAFPLLPYIQYNVEQERLGPWADVYEQFGPEAPESTRGKIPEMMIPEFVCPAVPRNVDQPKVPVCDFIGNTGLPDALARTQASVEVDEQDERGEGEVEQLGVADLPADWPANGVFQDQVPPALATVSRMSLEYLNEHDGAEHTLLFTENVDAGFWTDAEEPLVGFVWVPLVEEGEAVRQDALLAINEQRGQRRSAAANYQFARPSSFHRRETGGANAVYCDSRSTFIVDTIDYLVLTQLMTSNGNGLRYPGTEKPIGMPYVRE